MGDTLTVTAMAITVTTEDMDTVGGVIITDGVILTGGIIGGAIPMGGIILTIPTPIPIPIPITMEDCRGLPKGLLLRHNRDNNDHLIGTSVKTLRVTIPTLKIVRGVG